MDVTSLLNVSCVGGGLGMQRKDSIASSTPSATGDTTATSTAVPTPSPERAQSREASGSRSPTRVRNRTPWDAGGYSLPLTIDTKSIPSPADARPAFLDDSPIEGSHTSLGSPISQGAHKLSASRSSLSSSYSSSSYSTTNHSRISSLSTVSEFGSLPQPNSNNNNNNSSSCCYHTSSPPNSKHQRFYSQQLTFPTIAHLENSASMGDRRLTCRNPDIGPEQENSRLVMNSNRSSRSSSIAVPIRANSPSDAVFIRRGHSGSGEPSPVDGSNGSDANGIVNITTSRDATAHSRQPSASHSPHIQDVEPCQSGVPVPLSSHANDIADNAVRVYGPNSPNPADNVRLFLTGNLVDLVIGPPDHQFPFTSNDDMWRMVDFRHPKFCVFKLDCNINSDPKKANWRKGMSHVFGRNKNETRAIPAEVWVHFCRKHYQRARYRNDEGYLRRIIYMIIAQILRVEAWSNYNLEQRQPEKGQLKGWTLHLRKRESEKRSKVVDESKKFASEPGRGTKRKAEEIDEDLDEDDIPAEGEDDMLSNNRSMVTLPDWLLALCSRAPGEEPVTHKSAEIIRFIQRLFDDLRPMGKGDLPDFEILPVIEGETAKSKAKATKAKNKSVGRKQSVGDLLREKHRGYDEDQDDLEEGIRLSREDAKRARITQPVYPPRTMSRTIPEMRPVLYAERVQGDWTSAPSSRLNRGGSLDQPRQPGILPNPMGYREQEVRSSTHQRSVSDVGNVGYWSNHQTATSSYPNYSSYSAPDGYSTYGATQDRARNGSYSQYLQPQYQQAANWGPRWPAVSSYGQDGYGSSMVAGTHAKHVRHQSTPVVTRPMASYVQPAFSASNTHGLPMSNGYSQTRLNGTGSVGSYYQHYDHNQDSNSGYQAVSGSSYSDTPSAYQQVSSDSYSNGYANVNGGDLSAATRTVDRSYSQADFSAQQPVASLAPRTMDNRTYQASGDGYQDFGAVQSAAGRGSDNNNAGFGKSEVDQFARRV